MAFVLYHTTTDEAAQDILADGFKDRAGSYMMAGVVLAGVWLATPPVGPNEGCKGDFELKVTLQCSEEDIAEFEVVEEGRWYREWCVPATLVNSIGVVEVFEDDGPPIS